PDARSCRSGPEYRQSGCRCRIRPAAVRDSAASRRSVRDEAVQWGGHRSGCACSSVEQASKRREILEVFLHVGAFVRFEAHRQSKKARIVQQAPKRFEPNVSLADVLMAIDTRMEILQRIVQMKRDDPIESDMLVQFSERLVVALIGTNIVAGCERM